MSMPEDRTYSIQIGANELFKNIAELNNEKDISKLLKIARVRVGTLLKTDNISFLIGAGASLPAGGITLQNIHADLEMRILKNLNTEGISAPPINNSTKLFYETLSFLSGTKIDVKEQIASLTRDEKHNVITYNIEDYLSILQKWWYGIGKDANEMRLIGKDSSLILKKEDLAQLLEAIVLSLSQLMQLPKPKAEESLNVHKSFIKKILTRPLNLRRVNLFTLNYDTLIEQAADAEGAVLVDGFVGNLQRVFRPESYDLDFYFPAQTTEGRVHRFDRALHLYKLHGSINWHQCEHDWGNPYGIYASYFDGTSQNNTLIYPSPLKHWQTLDLPYSELFRRFGASIIQHQSILFTIGYGFGDEHVNAIIRQSLAIPSFTLIVVDPNPQSKFVAKLRDQKDERIWIISGEELGTFEHFVDKLLPDLREEDIKSKVIQTYNTLQETFNAEKD